MSWICSYVVDKIAETIATLEYGLVKIWAEMWNLTTEIASSQLLEGLVFQTSRLETGQQVNG